MNGATEMGERHGRILGELSELGLTLARDLHERALAAETPAEAADLANAFHRISRSVRQTLALEARLDRDARRAEREDQAHARREATARVETRKAQVRLAVERLIWTEAEDHEAEDLLADLDDHLDEAALRDDFTQTPLDTHIQRLTSQILPLRGRWPNPPPPGVDREARRAAGSQATRRGPEGVDAHSAIHPAPQPPHPLRGSSPCGGASDPPDPPLRGRWPEGPEGVDAPFPIHPAPQPPHPLRGSSPNGGPSDWRSSG